jgi:hypothetical protein
MMKDNDTSIRAVLKGQIATLEIKGGGFARIPAPHDGLLVETTTSTFLLPADQVARALAELSKEPTERVAVQVPVR